MLNNAVSSPANAPPTPAYPEVARQVLGLRSEMFGRGWLMSAIRGTPENILLISELFRYDPTETSAAEFAVMHKMLLI